MNCTICKMSETQPGKATLVLERGESIIIIKEVPAHICENCGERYFDTEITRKALQKAEEAVRNGAELEVLRLVA